MAARVEILIRLDRFVSSSIKSVALSAMLCVPPQLQHLLSTLCSEGRLKPKGYQGLTPALAGAARLSLKEAFLLSSFLSTLFNSLFFHFPAYYTIFSCRSPVPIFIFIPHIQSILNLNCLSPLSRSIFSQSPYLRACGSVPRRSHEFNLFGYSLWLPYVRTAFSVCMHCSQCKKHLFHQ